MKLESRYVKDKSQGFYLQQISFDKLLLETNDTLIKNTYAFLQMKLQDEVVKDCMVK